VVRSDRGGHVTGRRRACAVLQAHHATLELRLLELVAVILEPDLDLQRAEAQRRGQLVALARRQVALLAEAPLQLARLRLAEQHAPLPPRADARRRRATGTGSRRRRRRRRGFRLCSVAVDGEKAAAILRRA